jgi:hypothetical protein
MMTTFDQTLDMVMRLSYEQRQMLTDILSKRQTEERREEISQNAKEAIRAFHAGELKAETADQLIRRLNASVGDEDGKEKTQFKSQDISQVFESQSFPEEKDRQSSARNGIGCVFPESRGPQTQREIIRIAGMFVRI